MVSLPEGSGAEHILACVKFPTYVVKEETCNPFVLCASDPSAAQGSLKLEQVEVCITKSEPLPEEHLDITTMSIKPILLNLDLKPDSSEQEGKSLIKSETHTVMDCRNTSQASETMLNDENSAEDEHEILVLKEHEDNSQERRVCHTLRYTTKRQSIKARGEEAWEAAKHTLIRGPAGGSICMLCGRAFVHKGYLRVHMRIHTGEKPYSCRRCGKGFTRSDRLAEHMMLHTEAKMPKSKPKKVIPKSHSCDQCGKTFSKLSYLHAHQRGHSKVRSHVCSLCNVKFIHLSDLRRHVRGHMGRPHSCNECGQQFRRADTLRKHLRIHTGERSFTCTSCGKTYRHQESLRQHLKLHKQYDLNSVRR